MTDTFYDDPTNRIVSVFPDVHSAEVAVEELKSGGFPHSAIRIFSGDQAADKLDVSAKWFADTDEELKTLEHELREGKEIVTVVVLDADSREMAHDVLKTTNASRITHFGEWVTEVLR